MLRCRPLHRRGPGALLERPGPAAGPLQARRQVGRGHQDEVDAVQRRGPPEGLLPLPRAHGQRGQVVAHGGDLLLVPLELPDVPAEAQPGLSPLPVVLAHERFEEEIGRRVGRIGDTAEDGGQGGEEDAEVELPPGERPLEGEEGVRLGAEVPAARLAVELAGEPERALPHRAGGVHHAVEGAEARLRGGNGRGENEVSRDHHHLGSQLAERPHAGLLLGRQRRRLDESEAGPRRAGEIAGEGVAVVFEAAGQQVDTIPAQRGRSGAGLLQAYRRVAGERAAVAAPGDQRLARGGGELRRHRVEGALAPAPAGRQRHVHGTAGEAGDLLRQDLEQAAESRPLRPHRLLRGERAEAARHHRQLAGRPSVPGHRPDEPEQAVEAPLLGRLEARGVHDRRLVRGQAPGMDHHVGQPILGAQVGEQRLPQLRAQLPGLDSDHLAGLRQPRRELPRRAPRRSEDQPAPGRLLCRRGRQGRRPGREPEPVRHLRPFSRPCRPCCPCRPFFRRRRLDPVALPLEGIPRQRHPPPPLLGMEAGPVEAQAG